MQAILVSIKPSNASQAANRPALCAELLASVAARTSRDNHGLEAILAMIDPEKEDNAIDTIFRHVDYGHQSIADMVPVIIFMEDVTLALAYFIFSVCPTGAGQESSTRYIKMERMPTAEELEIPGEHASRWHGFIEESFDAYQQALSFWNDLAHTKPELVRIPPALLSDASDKAKKAIERIKRNFSFDRARCFLPAAAKTNMAMVMSARGWAKLRRMLLSHPLPEANRLGQIVEAEMQLEMPRMMRHSNRHESVVRALRDELEEAAQLSQEIGDPVRRGSGLWEAADSPHLDVSLPRGVNAALAFPRALANHDTRYAPFGSALRRTNVRFSWEGMGLAEIRDLNRHRTGEKFCPPSPVGFHAAIDQIPSDWADSSAARNLIRLQDRLGEMTIKLTRERLLARASDHSYWHLLGTQFPFEHSTTANQFIYEMELRTGTGAHYRYDMHCRGQIGCWLHEFPETRGLILQGSAEPE